MTPKPIALLPADLGWCAASRPRVSNDNPYGEAAFKTLKYWPAFPNRFGYIHDAHALCDRVFTYNNHKHRHSGIGLHTPASVHFGTATDIRTHRGPHPNAAYERTPPVSAPPQPQRSQPPSGSTDPHSDRS